MQMNISLEVAVLLEFTSRYHDYDDDTTTLFLLSYSSFVFPSSSSPTPFCQYIGFAEDMMLILFLVCILATLVTVHRATCYRQFQVRTSNFPSSQIMLVMFVLKKKSQLGGRVLP